MLEWVALCLSNEGSINLKYTTILGQNDDITYTLYASCNNIIKIENEIWEYVNETPTRPKSRYQPNYIYI